MRERHDRGDADDGARTVPPFEWSPGVFESFERDRAAAGATGHASGKAAGGAPAGPARLSRRARAVPKKQPRWLWQRWLPEGELCLLDGDPGLGKSTLVIDLVARVTRGWQMPPGPREPEAGAAPRNAVMIVGEDSLEYTVVHRLEAAGADMDRVVFHEGFQAADGHERDFDLGTDLADLAALVAAEKAALVSIDPVMAFLGLGVDAHKDQDVRRLLRPLSRLAQDGRATVLGVRHLNKLNGGLALYRGGGSIGIVGAARAALIAGTDPDDESGEAHVLAMNKCNLGPRPAALAYRLETVAAGLRIAWGGTVELRPNDILGGAGPGGRPDAESRDARQFLLDLLADGPVEAARVREHADAAGHAWRTVARAKTALKVDCWQVARKWMWALPPSEAKPE